MSESNNDSRVISISVRSLVEFVLLHGDLVSGFAGSSRLGEAIKAHQTVQKSSLEDYAPEVALSLATEIEGVRFQISGRADGIIRRENGIFIDEIKTTTGVLEFIEEDSNRLHWAQAQCYAYMYATENCCSAMGVQVTYYQLDTAETKIFFRILDIAELQEFFEDLLRRYLAWARMIQDWEGVRDRSIAALEFPFASYRPGQRELAGGVYKTIREGHKLFIQAPTGTGKTIATIFPALKALAEHSTSRIFYLTAKTVTRTIAEDSLAQMRQRGLRVKSATLTAKDKVCLVPGAACTADECEYARGYYDRVREASKEIFQQDQWNRSTILEHALTHQICPFEFSLDLALWADIIICDYNYAFDPRVYLKRFFADGGGDFTFLIDEAHNLLDRAREMFSAQLFKQSVLDLKKATKEDLPKVSKSLATLNTVLLGLRKQCEEMGTCVSKEQPKELYPALRKFTHLAEEYLVQNQPTPFREQLLEFYFKACAFLRTAEIYDQRYVTYYEGTDQDFFVKLFCLDPSHLLREGMRRGKASILFSATLSPLEYFIQSLGGDEDSYKLRLTSPFASDNLCLLVEDKISTKYRTRINSYGSVAEVIGEVVRAKTGNYLVFFPSYRYLAEVQVRFSELYPEVDVICQTTGMSEVDRENFLHRFESGGGRNLVGFALMGGLFGEGIDLTGERLTGAIIVGVGLPQVCLEREVIRCYFQEEMGNGFEYAYIYPGMNKVLQAAGRVIRTESDRGVVVLIDERFGQPGYTRLFPPEWRPHKVGDNRTLRDELEKFWLG